MLGTIVNSAGILAGALIGLIFKRGIPEKMSDTLMKGLGLCTLFIGLTGAMKGENSMIIIISVIIGTLIGEGFDLEDKLNRLGKWLEKKVVGESSEKGSFAEGFVTSSLVVCVGAMAIVGSLQSGLVGNHDILYNKAILDFVISIIFASTMGVGVVFSAGMVFIYQGAITLLAQWISPFLTDAVINEMTCVGSIIIIGLAFNMLGMTKLKVMNYVPAVFVPILLCRFM